MDSIQERLYASVDELYFADGFENGRRKLSSYVNSADGAATANSFFVQPGQPSDGKVNLERLRFFLTAQSRMPEINLFGLPRIAAWPVADEKGLEYEAGKAVVGVSDPKAFRTGFDQLIAFCSSMGKTGNSGEDSYFFRRKCAYSPTRDIELPRNKALIAYLFTLLEQKYREVPRSRTNTPRTTSRSWWRSLTTCGRLTFMMVSSLPARRICKVPPAVRCGEVRSIERYTQGTSERWFPL